MSVETEVQEIKSWCGQVRNQGRKIRAVDVLSKSERDRLAEESAGIEQDIANMQHFKRGDPTALIKRRDAIKDKIEDFAPRPMSAGARAELQKEEARVLETIVPALIPSDQLRRNPSGTVGKLFKGEMSSATKDAILYWRNLRKQIYQDDPDPELCSVERHRPSGIRYDGTSTFMPDAQIPGFHAMTPRAKENWPENMGREVNSAAAQAAKASTQAKPARGRRKPNLTPERREAMREHMLAVTARKKAKKEAEAAAYGGMETAPAAQEG